MHLIPAYGRDYKSQREIRDDLQANKDFVIADMSSPYDGKPVNLEQLQEKGERTINVRYKRLTEVAVFQVAKLKIGSIL